MSPDSDAKVYDGFTGKWRAPRGDHEKTLVGIAEASAKGPQTKLPSDRTEEELQRLEPGFAGPTLTAGPEGGSAAAGAGVAGGVRP